MWDWKSTHHTTCSVIIVLAKEYIMNFQTDFIFICDISTNEIVWRLLPKTYEITRLYMSH